MIITKEKRYHVANEGEYTSFRNEEDMDAYCKQLECYDLCRKKFSWMSKPTFYMMYSHWDEIKSFMDKSIKQIDSNPSSATWGIVHGKMRVDRVE